jgi:hypothetical protein
MKDQWKRADGGEVAWFAEHDPRLDYWVRYRAR